MFKKHYRDSLVVQLLGLNTSTVKAWVQFLVRELRLHIQRGMDKRKRKERKIKSSVKQPFIDLYCYFL